MLLAVVCAPRCALGRHYSCRHHEELRGDGLWVVDCRGDVVEEVNSLANGKFRYKAPVEDCPTHQWSSHDRNMGSVTVDLPECSTYAASALARCLQVPPFFVWCVNATSVVAVYDSDFPRSYGAHDDLAEDARKCGAVARRGCRYRAYNVRDVEQNEAAVENAQNVIIGIIVMVILFCFGCQGKQPRYNAV